MLTDTEIRKGMCVDLYLSALELLFKQSYGTNVHKAHSEKVI